MKLKKVYIFIEAGYKWGKGLSEEKTDAVYKEIVELLTPLGFDRWIPQNSNSAPICFKGNEEDLYCHPMELVGLVDIDNTLPAIEKALKNAKLMKHRHTDIYDIKQDDITWHTRKLGMYEKYNSQRT